MVSMRLGSKRSTLNECFKVHGHLGAMSVKKHFQPNL